MAQTAPLAGVTRRPEVDDATTLLVDHWYSHAVGHVIEALRRCQAYHACDPALRVALVLNGASPLELARCATFVDKVYGVPYTSFGRVEGNPRRALRSIPRDWDYVVHHPASVDAWHERFEGFARYSAAARRHFRARIASGIAGSAPPAYEPWQRLRLELPEEARALARRELNGRQAIAVMPAGSGARLLYPSVASWVRILDALAERFPGAVFTLVGRVNPGSGRTVSGITRPEVDRLLAGRLTIDAFDRPILEQLAAVEAAQLFVSPHTGFGFAAVAVDTPWLTLAGGDWHEYFFNGVPFYAVLPKGTEHPAFVHGNALPRVEADVDGEGARAWAMRAERVRDDLDELVEAAAQLVEGRLSYDEALATYVPRLLDAYQGDRTQLYSFEDLVAGLG
jgi:hypothetical protein